MSKIITHDGNAFLQTYRITQLNASFIDDNKDKIFTAWVEVWKGSQWSKEEYFDRDESIEYISSISKIGLSYSIEHDTKIIAFVMASLLHFSPPKNTAEKRIQQKAKRLLQKPGYFHELAILDAYRGKGLGNALMSMMETNIQKIGADGMFLWTRKESRSQNLYLKRGYTTLGETIVPKNNIVGKEHRVYYIKSF
jgi:ribosomal protein S18 acetylase RimI-like enzyme